MAENKYNDTSSTDISQFCINRQFYKAKTTINYLPYSKRLDTKKSNMALLWRLSIAFAHTGLETYPRGVQQFSYHLMLL